MAERPAQRAAAAKRFLSLQLKLEAELFEHPGRVAARFGREIFLDLQPRLWTRGRWDPYDTFTNKESLSKFFSGHDYGRFSLIDRERFAKFSIEKVLENHPDDRFEITGEILKNVSVTDQPEDTEALGELATAIGAAGQQDVDVEFSRDHNTRDDVEPTQKISAAVQALMTASPNSLGPPINPCATYLKMTKCGCYGRSNAAVWRSPLIRNLDNRDERRGLLDHQITAIVWLLSRMFGDLPTLTYWDPDTRKYRQNIVTPAEKENRDRLKGPKYFGGILADSMGLGKTIITVALVDLLVSQGLNAVQNEYGISKYRPILLITPNATVANQWVQELSQVMNESAHPVILVSGRGLERQTNQHNVFFLDREDFDYWPDRFSYVWNEDNPKASRVILIMTLDSWAARTCSCYKEEDKEPVWTSSFTKLKRKFSLVVVDEAHRVKNYKTRNWRSIYLLERQFTVLITATPCTNTLTDLMGLAMLLWTTPHEYLMKDQILWETIHLKFGYLDRLDLLEEYSPSHDFQLAAGRPGLLAKILCKPWGAATHNINLARQYLKHFEALAMLKRSPSSYLYDDWDKTGSVSLEGLYPEVKNYTVDISAGKAHDEEYQRVHTGLLIEYLKGLRAWSDVVGKRDKKLKKEGEDAKEPIINARRLLQLASSSLDVYDLDTIITEHGHSTLAVEVAQMRENGVNLRRLAQFLLLPTQAKPDTHVGWMKLAIRKSPILRYILQYIKKNILTRQRNEPIRKLLIIESNPMVAFYYELVLQFLGFECRCMHAQLSVEERQELVDSFNSSKRDSCQIFIQLYTVGFAGTNLHKSCSRVLVASQAHSLQVQSQAIHRVIRVGQNSNVTVHRLKLKNSYHSFSESRQVEKMLPELGARAQGSMKIALIRLLNIFQYEVREAWNSHEGKRLRREKNLLEDDVKIEEADPITPAAKRVKQEDNKVGVKVECEEAKIKAKVEGLKEEVKIKVEPGNEAKAIKIIVKPKAERGCVSTRSVPKATKASGCAARLKRKECDTVTSEDENGRRGWNEDEEFLKLCTRNDYYNEFVGLPRDAKRRFSFAKNELRRLLSYGSSDGGSKRLSRVRWTEEDLEDPAVLERALELVLRVRLGARAIAMLPYPFIDLSRAPASIRAQLRDLLSCVQNTDQDLQPAGASTGGSRENLHGVDIRKSLDEIDRDLEAEARFGTVPTHHAIKIKEEEKEALEENDMDSTGGDDDDGSDKPESADDDRNDDSDDNSVHDNNDNNDDRDDDTDDDIRIKSESEEIQLEVISLAVEEEEALEMRASHVDDVGDHDVPKKIKEEEEW
ncbi:P-loop containing nucleoside triphosphate hydrolase protein [Nemania sp. FL0916]|nr:P-loop containing nucleoside triphosphate hydrolase protein [Nemania sp. FL0916]